MPQKPKPAYMYAQDNKTARRTKKTIKILQDHTIKIGGKEYHAPASIKNNKIAKAKWLEIMNLYKDSDVEITTNADIGLLERYCLTYWEYKELIRIKKLVYEQNSDPVIAAEIIHKLRIESQINQKNTLLMRMDEQLFLTPLSKCRAIPRTKKKSPEKSELEKKGFNL